jgi:hypothetical protein
METLLANSVFEPFQAAILTKAFEEAIRNLDGFEIDAQARSKLAAVVLTIARKRIDAGGALASDADASSVASIASDRLLSLRAG